MRNTYRQGPLWSGLTAVSDSHHHHDVSLPVSRRTRIFLTAAAVVVVAMNATGLVTNVFGIDTALIVALAGGYPLVSRAIAAIMRRQISYDVTIAFAAIVAVAPRQF